MGRQVWGEGRGGEGRDYLCFFHAALRCELNPRLQALSSRVDVMQTLVPLKCSAQAVLEAQQEEAAAFYSSLNGGIVSKPPW